MEANYLNNFWKKSVNAIVTNIYSENKWLHRKILSYKGCIESTCVLGNRVNLKTIARSFKKAEISKSNTTDVMCDIPDILNDM